MPFRNKRPPVVPDPGQRVELVGEDGSVRGGFRAVSVPLTSETGEVIVRVATEEEYREAGREGRRAVSLPWPAERVAVRLPWWRELRLRWLAR